MYKLPLKKAGVNLADFSVETEKYRKNIIRRCTFCIAENANAVGWYDEKVSKAVGNTFYYIS